MKDHISKWILIPSFIFSLLGIAVGISLYLLPPQTFIPGIDPTAKGISYLVQMWAARQIAIGSVICYAAFKKSVPMLKITLLAYLIMQIQDVVIGIIQKDSGLSIGAGVIGLITLTMLYSLNKKHTND